MANKVEYVKKYQATRDAIMLRPSKEDGQIVRSAAKKFGMSVQAFAMKAMFEYIENHEEEPKMKTYKIKPEFLSAWGEETTEETIITEAEIERLSSEWGVSVDTLMEQVEEE